MPLVNRTPLKLYAYKTMLNAVGIVPIHILRFLFDSYVRHVYAKSYSENGEDRIIKHFLEKVLPGPGKYLDIGAYHPTFGSNTHLLHLAGWTGVVVDIEDYKLNLFARRKGKAKTLRCAVTSNPTKSKKKMLLYEFNSLFSACNTVIKEDAEKINQLVGIDYSPVEVEIEEININDLLGTDNFNFVSVDIEGRDKEIISSIDFSNIYKPEVIVFESWAPFSHSKACAHLEQNGYERLFIAGCNLGYYLKEKIPPDFYPPSGF